MLSKKIRNFIFCFLILFSSTSFAFEKEKFDLIVDTDAAIDDWAALLYVLNLPEQANLLGVTIPGTGEAHCAPAKKNMANLVYLANREKDNIVVTCGDSVPMEGFHTFPDAWRIDMDNLFGLHIKENPTPNILAEHSVEWLNKTLSKNKRPVVILTLGPLTNIGQLLQKYPASAKKIKRIYMMGGAFETKGNLIIPGITDGVTNTFAEWNIWVDPLSAKIVFNSNVPVTVVSLDVTNKVQVTREFLAEQKKYLKTESAKFYDDVLEKNLDFIDSGEYYFWHVLAAAAMYLPICHENLKTVDVVTKYDANTTGDEQMKSFGPKFSLVFDQFKTSMLNRYPFEQVESGRTVFVTTAQQQNKNHTVCSDANAKLFKEHFIKTLNAR